jgi:hypothetical protein
MGTMGNEREPQHHEVNWDKGFRNIFNNSFSAGFKYELRTEVNTFLLIKKATPKAAFKLLYQ